jgi:hypothetical protein
MDAPTMPLFSEEILRFYSFVDLVVSASLDQVVVDVIF